jgi:PAP2 superfamily
MAATATQQWVCPTCRNANPVEADLCGGCGLSFTAQLRGSPAPAVRGPSARSVALTGAVREIGIVVGLFVLWKVASAITIGGTASALSRGRWVYHLERALHFPSEVRVQAGVLGHPTVVQALNLFYLIAHLGSLVIFLPWMFIRHRDSYKHWRNVIAVFTLLSLLMQLVTVAPPRLLTQYGFVDTAARYHQSAYSHIGQGMVGQLSSMPSIHVGWAIVIAIAVITTSTSRWRWLILAHPILTGYAVVATANHYWLDGVVAGILVALVLLGQRLLRTVRASRADGELTVVQAS